MTRILPCGAALIVFSGALLAQGQVNTSAVLTAPRAGYVYLVLKNDKTFQYSLDSKPGVETRKGLGSGLLLSSRNSDGLNVILAYVNPIKYSWTFGDSTIASAVARASSQFFTALTAQFGVVQGGSPSVPLPASMGSQVANDAGASAPGGVTTPTAVPRVRAFAHSSAMLAWEQWLTSPPCTDTAYAGLMNAIRKVDTAAKVTDTAIGDTTYRHDVIAAIMKLTNASSVAELRAANVAAESLRARPKTHQLVETR